MIASQCPDPYHPANAQALALQWGKVAGLRNTVHFTSYRVCEDKLTGRKSRPPHSSFTGDGNVFLHQGVWWAPEESERHPSNSVTAWPVSHSIAEILKLDPWSSIIAQELARNANSGDLWTYTGRNQLLGDWCSLQFENHYSSRTTDLWHSSQPLNVTPPHPRFLVSFWAAVKDKLTAKETSTMRSNANHLEERDDTQGEGSSTSPER